VGMAVIRLIVLLLEQLTQVVEVGPHTVPISQTHNLAVQA